MVLSASLIHEQDRGICTWARKSLTPFTNAVVHKHAHFQPFGLASLVNVFVFHTKRIAGAIPPCMRIRVIRVFTPFKSFILLPLFLCLVLFASVPFLVNSVLQWCATVTLTQVMNLCVGPACHRLSMFGLVGDLWGWWWRDALGSDQLRFLVMVLKEKERHGRGGGRGKGKVGQLSCLCYIMTDL